MLAGWCGCLFRRVVLFVANEHLKPRDNYHQPITNNQQPNRFLSAWTLMGHEFVELKNTGAAIEAYRRATDVSARDYRAWYGLGQVYEILQKHNYALYYFRKACALRPYDARMWCALAECYEKLGPGRKAEAIRCYRRGEASGDGEGIAALKLARLFKSLSRDRAGDGNLHATAMETGGTTTAAAAAAAGPLGQAATARSADDDAARYFEKHLLRVGRLATRDSAAPAMDVDDKDGAFGGGELKGVYASGFSLQDRMTKDAAEALSFLMRYHLRML